MQAAVVCPYCGEPEVVAIDFSGGARQSYTEDCAVCCRPHIIHVEAGADYRLMRVWADRED